MTALSVNLNKIALLRNSREGQRPSVIEFAREAIAAGAKSPIGSELGVSKEF